MRTTIDLDAPVLRELKRLQKREGKSLGRLVSDLVAEAMSARTIRGSTHRPFRWISRSMNARVDLRDKEAVHRLLNDETPAGPSASSRP